MIQFSQRVARVCLALLVTSGCVNEGVTQGEPEAVDSTEQELRFFDHLDLDVPADNLKALMKVRGSLDPNKETIFYFKGVIYSLVQEQVFPAQKSNKKLFTFEGFNIARIERLADGYRLLSREVAVYGDPTTGAILDCWENPFNGKVVPVVHVANDPFNLTFVASTWTPVPTLAYGDRVLFGVDTLLAVPSPLRSGLFGSLFAEYSVGDLYQAAELFNYGTNRLELDATFLDSASADVSWSRISGWLPWMKMGDTPEGFLLYQARGFKIRSFEALPRALKAFTLSRYPEYRNAPSSFATPNENSWSNFRDQFQSGEYDPLACAN